ncbi:Coiled-coil domain-containing protein 134 [Takifugu flavidus]|uniref:Coiled-coil domain-containing protein 134 n=1 Tax=Takifugu flavidus TaxID=433684 RepID=A0A5C6NRJ2_9TELE|nr:Coiled-coil domain-containing protein 134 [Takifugu flavidus]
MSGSSVTKHCQHGITELTENQDSQKDGTERRKRKILVVDVPGFGDTSLSGEQILDEVTKCVAVAAPGPHAFLLVVPLGRYTDSENQALCQLAGIFGENAVRHHTVVLFTRGDELEGLEIETYLRDSRNPLLNSLIERCGGRYHVFNNKETGNTLQVEELLMKVDNMVKHTAEGFYTNEMFSEAEAIIREEQERMGEQGEADGQSASEEKFSGKSTSSLLTNRRRTSPEGRMQRIWIVVAAAATGFVVGATLGQLSFSSCSWGIAYRDNTYWDNRLCSGSGGTSRGRFWWWFGIIAGTEAASAREAAFNTLQQPSGDSRGGEALTDGMDNGEYHISTVDNMDTTLAELGDEFTLGDIDVQQYKLHLIGFLDNQDDIFQVLEDSRQILVAANMQPDDPFPMDDKIKEGLAHFHPLLSLFSPAAGCTLPTRPLIHMWWRTRRFFGDVALRFPRIVHHYFDRNSEWGGLLRWGLHFCNQTGVFTGGAHQHVLTLMSQELGITEKTPDFMNPYRTERDDVLHTAEAFKKILREEEKRRRKEEKRKEIRKGPRISRLRSEL